MPGQEARFANRRSFAARHNGKAGSLVWGTTPTSGSWIGHALTAFALLLCAVQMLVLRASAGISEGVGYLSTAGVHLALLAASALVAQRVSVRVRLRWRLVAIACGFGALGYLVAAAGRLHFVSLPANSPWGTWLFDTRESLLLLAVLRIRRPVHRLLLLDIAQALLFLLLRFSLTGAPLGQKVFAANHLLVSLAVSVFFLVLAWTASLGAVDNEEHWTLRVFALLFAARALQLSCGNLLAGQWLGQVHGSVWDLAGTVASLLLAIYLVRRAPFAGQLEPAAFRRTPCLAVRGLMPTFLVAGNLALALMAAERSRWLGICGVCATTCWYGFRVMHVHQQTLWQSTRLQERNQELEQFASRDPLTSIGNRHSLGLAFNRLQQQSPLAPFSFFLTDADSFKQANDHLGHLHGDEVLITIATVLHAVAALHPESHCSRLGGDEFAVLLPGVDQPAALRCAERVRSAIQDLALPAGNLTITLSIGVASMACAAGTELATVLSRADSALYAAKQCGRNCVRSYEENAAILSAEFPTAAVHVPDLTPSRQILLAAGVG